MLHSMIHITNYPCLKENLIPKENWMLMFTDIWMNRGIVFCHISVISDFTLITTWFIAWKDLKWAPGKSLEFSPRFLIQSMVAVTVRLF